MDPKFEHSYEEVADLLNYDPETGKFLRLEGKGRGRTAGTLNGRGYFTVWVYTRHYYAHVLAWLLMTGEWPSSQIDHINGVKHDNRWENLRLVSQSENKHHGKVYSNNTTGFRGVYRLGRSRFYSSIKVNGRSIRLGTFSNPEVAYQAYLAAAKEYYGECAFEGP